MKNKDDASHNATQPETQVVHLGRAPFDNQGFVNPPVYRGSTVLFPTLEKSARANSRIRTAAAPHRRHTRSRRPLPISKAAR